MFVVLDTFEIVSSIKWHHDYSHVHEKLFLGTKEQCVNYVQLAASEQLLLK